MVQASGDSTLQGAALVISLVGCWQKPIGK